MLLSELQDLTDILDDITYKEQPCYFSIEEEIECIETCIQLMCEFIDDNPTAISDPDFHEIMIEFVKELLFIHFFNFFSPDHDLEDELDDLIEIASELFYIQIIPERSFSNTFEIKLKNEQKVKILNRLKYLTDLPQPAQRTPEWYVIRRNLITASNAYKTFESQSARNQLIYEKCQPLIIDATNTRQVNINSSLHWGQKYEPISVMYYESTYKTKVKDYGCIQHDKHKFLGASPDGIISDVSLPRFGRMLEIKNPVNRDIDGIPKKEYWIQMQLQMETCDLNECDFLETKFVEYTNETEFNADGCFLTTEAKDDKGIIMYFSTGEGLPHYVYKPLHMVEEYFLTEWEQKIMTEMELKGMIWIKNIYWKLEEVSCVLVLRNKKWFADNIGELSIVWDTIEKERETGFIHRSPAKRIKKNKDLPLISGKCLFPKNLINIFFSIKL